MPTKVNNFKVFVASPSDVVDEREILRQVIDELNKIVGSRQNLRLELVQWQTDTYPSIGEDAQSVINEQIGDDYDIFIGILWKRFGTPTKRGASGTAEEFTRAYNRARENPGQVHVMFYFNDSPIPISELDIEQVSQIKSFQSSLGEKGVYYFEYKSPDEFEKLVRMHLSRVMQDIKMATSTQPTTSLQEESPASLSEEESELQESEAEEGFLDLVISSVDEFETATETMKHIGELMEDMTAKMQKRTEELKNLPKPHNPRQMKIVIDGFARDLEDYVERTKVELPILSKAFHAGIAYSGQVAH